MGHGGRRPGAGRPKGAKERLRIPEVMAIDPEVGKTVLGMAIDMVLDEGNPKVLRLDAFKAVAPYLCRKMPVAVEHSGTEGGAPINVVSSILAPPHEPEDA